MASLVGPTLLDTGPLVALLNARDRHHAWAARHFDECAPPLLTCEAVLAEACHLLRHDDRGAKAIFGLLSRRVLELRFSLQDEAPAVEALMTRYVKQPISVADACLVRMAEIFSGSRVLTLDSDFQIYRIHGRRVIPTLAPISSP